MNANDLKQIGELVDAKISQRLEQKLEPIQKTLDQHGKMLRSLKRNQDTMLDMLDRGQMRQSKRIKRVEDHLHLPPIAT